jgi:hypothetical protein
MMLTSESQFLGSHLVVEIERSRVEWKVPPRRFTESDCGARGDSRFGLENFKKM